MCRYLASANATTTYVATLVSGVQPMQTTNVASVSPNVTLREPVQIEERRVTSVTATTASAITVATPSISPSKTEIPSLAVAPPVHYNALIAVYKAKQAASHDPRGAKVGVLKRLRCR